MTLDSRKSLPKFREEWESCTNCNLGDRRLAVDGNLVFGEGTTRGIMFIGEGPNKKDEQIGHPFTSDTGVILRKVIKKLGLTNFYMTNLVVCRSCTPWTNATGQPTFRQNWKTKQMEVSYRDENPSPTQIEACLRRLHEEIYLVDPVIIVTLGMNPAKVLLQRPVNIAAPDTRGQPFTVSIPGAGYTAALTEKKGAWLRTTGGKLSRPIEQTTVQYTCIPTHHPDMVAKKLADLGKDSTFRQFAGDIQKAMQVYERYMYETFGAVPTNISDVPIEMNPEELMGNEGEQDNE